MSSLYPACVVTTSWLCHQCIMPVSCLRHACVVATSWLSSLCHRCVVTVSCLLSPRHSRVITGTASCPCHHRVPPASSPHIRGPCRHRVVTASSPRRRLASRPVHFQLASSDERDDSDDSAHWLKFPAVLSTGTEKVWQALIEAMDKYR